MLLSIPVESLEFLMVSRKSAALSPTLLFSGSQFWVCDRLEPDKPICCSNVSVHVYLFSKKRGLSATHIFHSFSEAVSLLTSCQMCRTLSVQTVLVEDHQDYCDFCFRWFCFRVVAWSWEEHFLQHHECAHYVKSPSSLCECDCTGAIAHLIRSLKW